MPEFVRTLVELHPVWLYLAIFGVAYLENIFPPSPSDVVVVFGGALAAMGEANVVVALISGAAGSTLGFVTMYGIGKWFGKRILDEGRLRFIPKAGIQKLEGWFVKYGYWLIVVNRFLAGTRAVVSFFAGMSELRLDLTVVLSLISSVFWYGILVTVGYLLGDNWERIGSYLATYSQVVTGIAVVVVLVLVVRYFLRRRRR